MIDKLVGFSNSTQPVLLPTVCIINLFKIVRLHNRQKLHIWRHICSFAQ